MEYKEVSGSSLVKWVLGLGVSLFVAAGVTGWYKYYLGDKNRDNIQKAAVADLDLVFKAEKSFKQRFGYYTTDLVSLRVAPKYVFYKFGFLKPMAASEPSLAATGHDPARMNLDLVKQARPDANIAFSEQTKLEAIDFTALGTFCGNCTATADTFRAIAAANLDDDSTLDVWTIDQEGKVEHLSDDLRIEPKP